MRRAKASDAWRRLRERPSRPFEMPPLIIEELPFSSATVILGPTITVVAGLNGSGKTKLLELIRNKLEYSENRLDPESESATYSGPTDSALERSTDRAPRVAWFDPVEKVVNRRQRIAADVNFDDLLQPIEPRSLPKKDLIQVGNVVGKEYTAISIYELDDPSSTESGTYPFFEVTVGATTYDTKTMGLGELAVLELFWFLESLDGPTVVLIDEHNALVSQRSAAALLDMMADYSARDLYFVIATHSPAVLERLRPDEIVTCVDVNGTLYASNIEDLSVVTNLLGATGSVRVIAFVEDRVAALVLREVLQQYGGHWTDGVEIAATTGDGDLRKLRQHLPNRTEKVAFVIVVDGDVQAPDEFAGTVHILSLPGNHAPEVLIKKAVTANIAGLAAFVGTNEDTARTILGSLQGRDHHDWLDDLSTALRIPSERLVAYTLAQYGNIEEGRSELESIADQFRTLVTRGDSSDSSGQDGPNRTIG